VRTSEKTDLEWDFDYDTGAKKFTANNIYADVHHRDFFAGVSFLAVSFFSLLFALNHLNLSLVAPASASLTLVTNAVAAKFFLKENVDHRRWTAAVLVCIGVYFLAH